MKISFITCCFLFIIVAAQSQRLTRDYNVDILTNQVGYTPAAGKQCHLKTGHETKFEVIETTSGRIAFSGTLRPVTGDFGTYATADFTSLNKEGTYYIKADTFRSYPFVISKTVYQHQMNDVVNYFSKQRCGASSTGYLAPCHVDDGIRFDNGMHQDVSGGWHDASDLRKWVSATLYGVIGLARAYDLEAPQYRKAMLDEIKWGNQYFLKMQEPQGYVMDFVGGDLKKHSDNNRWTDNVTGEKGTGIELVLPNTGNWRQSEMLVSKEHDDRIIQTQPVEMMAQYNFIGAQAMVARIAATADPGYAKKCIEAAKKCYTYCVKNDKDTATGNAGAALQAAIEMYRTTKDETYKRRAIAIAGVLKKLQVDDGEVSGFFRTSLTSNEPYKNIWNGCQAFIGLADLDRYFPGDKDAGGWKQMIKRYADEYLLMLSDKNNFGIVPWGLYTQNDPGGNRKIGSYWYRYFMQPEGEWWVGINSNIASAGVGLYKAGIVLKDEKMKAAAQKQLDWIMGSNPFNSSTMRGSGYNHPKHFEGSSFTPAVPLIDGAVVNGLGGDHNDMPYIGNGDWQVSEYWTPMVAYTLWLMAELSAQQ